MAVPATTPALQVLLSIQIRRLPASVPAVLHLLAAEPPWEGRFHHWDPQVLRRRRQRLQALRHQRQRLPLPRRVNHPPLLSSSYLYRPLPLPPLLQSRLVLLLQP